MSDRVESNRRAIRDLYRHRPFQPFYIRLESGDRIDVEHPENISFDFRDSGDRDFFARSRDNRVFSMLAAITAVTVKMTGELVEE